MTTNISKVYLLNVPLEDDMKNTLYFASASAQQSYFNSVIGKTYLNVSYQSETRTFRCKDEIDTIRQYNYIMWQNPAFSNKWFYAFIKKMEFVSTGLTDVVFEVDPLQTYMFDITIKPSFVEREHTNNDAIGANTYPEDLELGEMVCNGEVINFGGASMEVANERFFTIVEVSQVSNSGDGSTLSYRWASGSHQLTPSIGGISRGTIPLVMGGTWAGSLHGVIRKPSDLVHFYDEVGLSDSIINIYMLPQQLVPACNEIYLKGKTSYELDGIYVPVSTSEPQTIGTYSFTRPTNLRGYIPRNQKLLSYPFNYFNISNNAGTAQPYRYEDFSGGASFKVQGTFGVGGSTKAMPQNYLNFSSSENTLDYSINGPKFPVCSWKSDSFTNWMTQNSVNLSMQWNKEMIGAGVDVAGGAARGFIGGAIAGSVGGPLGGLVGAGIGAATGVASLIGVAKEQFQAKTKANMVSDQVHGNTGAGDFLWTKYHSPFTFIPMSIKAEYARICDDWFDVFGYQVNRLKIPNTNHRANWWYTKTINANIVGNVPNDEMNKIKGAYNNGLTFWKNPSNFLNYSVSNGII